MLFPFAHLAVLILVLILVVLILVCSFLHRSF